VAEKKYVDLQEL